MAFDLKFTKYIPKWELAQFKIEDLFLENFRRYAATQNDCAINVLQIVGYYDNNEAAKKRIQKNNKKMSSQELIELLSKKYTQSYFSVKNVEGKQCDDICWKYIKPGFVSMVGYDGHIFLVGRSMCGQLLFIDAQIPTICTLQEASNKYIGKHWRYQVVYSKSKF